MATVPKYSGNVAQSGFISDRVPQEAPLAAFGGGDAIANVGQAAQGLVQDIEKRIDTTAVIEADNYLTEAKNNILNKVRTFKGKDAAGAQVAAEEDWAKEINKINENLNPRQRQKFAGVASQGWQNVYQSVQDHTNKELKEWEKNTKLAGIMTAQKDAVNNYKTEQGGVDLRMVNESIGKQAAILDAQAVTEGYGIGSEQNKLEKLEAATKTHSAVITDMLANGNDLDAKKYFETYKGQIDKESAKGIIASLESGSTRIQAVDLADSLIAQKGMSEKKALDEIRKVYEQDKNVEKREKAESRVKSHFNDVATRDDRSQSDMRKAASNILDKNGYDLSDPKVTLLLEQMNDSGKLAIRSYSNSRGNKSSDLQVLNAAENDLYETDKIFKESEILDLAISPAKKEELNDWNREKRNNTEKWQKRQGEFSTVNKIVKLKADQLGLKKKDKAFFEESLKKQIKAEQDLRGEKGLTTEEKEKIANDLTTRQALSFRIDPRKYMVNISDIPSDDLAQIKAAIVAQKLPMTDDIILRFFLQGKDE